jgi:ribosomal protein S18 acetylase RimI-like enzyme
MPHRPAATSLQVREPIPDQPGCTLRLAADAGVALTALQTIAEVVFPAADRPPGWFARKLAREAVDPAASVLAFGPDEQVVGYFLVGVGERIAHSAGLGVLPEFRRRGVAQAMIHRAAAIVRSTGLSALGALAEPPLRGFYERVGFHEVGVRHTLIAHACGPADVELAVHPPRPWVAAGRQVAGWRADTWSRTPSASAATLVLLDGAVTVHLSREGRAILVQRMCVDAASPGDIITTTHAALDELRRRFREGTPLLLYGCETVSCVTASLLHAGPWRVAQTACEMERRL